MPNRKWGTKKPRREGWGRDFTALPLDRGATDPTWQRKQAREFRGLGLSDADMHMALQMMGMKQNKQGNWEQGGGLSGTQLERGRAVMSKIASLRKKKK